MLPKVSNYKSKLNTGVQSSKGIFPKAAFRWIFITFVKKHFFFWTGCRGRWQLEASGSVSSWTCSTRRRFSTNTSYSSQNRTKLWDALVISKCHFDISCNDSQMFHWSIYANSMYLTSFSLTSMWFQVKTQMYLVVIVYVFLYCESLQCWYVVWSFWNEQQCYTNDNDIN